jgi:hypothetical protein
VDLILLLVRHHLIGGRTPLPESTVPLTATEPDETGLIIELQGNYNVPLSMVTLACQTAALLNPHPKSPCRSPWRAKLLALLEPHPNNTLKWHRLA